MTDAEPASDRALLECWRSGDADAGSRLFARHFQALYRFLRPRAGAELADLVQRSLLACVHARDRVPEGVEFRAYLLGIARKQLLMHWRKSGRHDRALQRCAAVPRSSRPTPSGLVARREQRGQLTAALRSLPLEQQLALELYYWQQLPVAQLALVLDISISAAKTRLYQARKGLRRAMSTPSSGAQPLSERASELSGWVRSMRARNDCRE